MAREISFLSISLSLFRKQTRFQLYFAILFLPSLFLWFKWQSDDFQQIINAYPITMLTFFLFTLIKGLQIIEQENKQKPYQRKNQQISFLEKLELFLWILMHISLLEYQSYTHVVDFLRAIIIWSKFTIYLGILSASIIYTIPYMICSLGNFIIFSRKFQIKLQYVWCKKYNKNEICVICLDKQTQIKLNCSHQYHLKCILKSSEVIPKCPLCMKRIVFP